jgi:hypothetical protein
MLPQIQRNPNSGEQPFVLSLFVPGEITPIMYDGRLAVAWMVELADGRWFVVQIPQDLYSKIINPPESVQLSLWDN